MRPPHLTVHDASLPPKQYTWTADQEEFEECVDWDELEEESETTGYGIS